MSKIICSGNIMRKAIPNCLTTNGIEGFVVSPVRITPKDIILTNKFHSAIKYYEI